MLGFKAVTEENLVREREKRCFILPEKLNNFIWAT
jgi:hypothetical protein